MEGAMLLLALCALPIVYIGVRFCRRGKPTIDSNIWKASNAFHPPWE